ncbi:hypothetical protein L0337_36450 [candidate division KSB1 bacterium]|nr:hypothetical protein [candidate division KSB1 bacterium]
MLRKSILFLSLTSIAALMAWGFAPGGSTPVCASAASAQGQCRLQVSVNSPTFQGTPAQPTGAAVSWTITNKPPCYRIIGSQVTFNFQLNNGSTARRVVNVPGNGTNASLNLATAPLPANIRPNGLTANVQVRAEADPLKIDAASNFVAIP